MKSRPQDTITPPLRRCLFFNREISDGRFQTLEGYFSSLTDRRSRAE